MIFCGEICFGCRIMLDPIFLVVLIHIMFMMYSNLKPTSCQMMFGDHLVCTFGHLIRISVL